MLRGFDGESRLTEVQRPLPSPLTLANSMNLTTIAEGAESAGEEHTQDQKR